MSSCKQILWAYFSLPYSDNSELWALPALVCLTFQSILVFNNEAVVKNGLELWRLDRKIFQPMLSLYWASMDFNMGDELRENLHKAESRHNTESKSEPKHRRADLRLYQYRRPDLRPAPQYRRSDLRLATISDIRLETRHKYLRADLTLATISQIRSDQK